MEVGGNKFFVEVLVGLRKIPAMSSSLKDSSGNSEVFAPKGQAAAGLSTSRNDEVPRSSIGGVSSSKGLLGVNFDFRTFRESLVSTLPRVY